MSNAPSGWRSPFKHLNKGLRRVLAGVAALMLIMTMGFIIWPSSLPTLDLKNSQSATTRQLLDYWANGEVVVLVRHAERCDRSVHPCLGPADGITLLGSTESTKLGHAYEQLGLGKSDVLSSPITRTAQTAQYMFEKQPATAQWLADCGPSMRNDVLAHKQAQRNLILVTHSGCIGDFEKQSGFKHAPSSEYNSSLFVLVTADGKAKVLGIANMPNWPNVATGAKL